VYFILLSFLSYWDLFPDEVIISLFSYQGNIFITFVSVLKQRLTKNIQKSSQTLGYVSANNVFRFRP